MAIVFDNQDIPISADRAIVHADERFTLQWVARNAGSEDVPDFIDRLVITHLPEGCPGDDSIDHEVMLDAEIDEAGLPAGTGGSVTEHEVGPFATGAYRVTVTLADDTGDGQTLAICIDIVDPV